MKIFIKLALFIIVPVFITILFLYTNLSNQLIDGIENSIIIQKKKDIENINLEFDNQIKNQINISKIASISNINEFENQEQLHRKTLMLLRSVPDLLSIKYIAQNGFEIIGVEKERSLKINQGEFFFNDKFFQIPLLENKVFTNIDIETITNDLTFTVSRKVIDINDGDILGVVLLKFSLHEFQNILINKLIDYYGIMISFDQKEVYKSKSMQNYKGNISLDKEVYKNINLNGVETTIFELDYPNKMKYIFAIKNDKFYSFINNTINNNILLLSMVLILIFIFLLFIMKNILKPLEVLTKTIRNKISLLDNNKTISLDRKNEIEELYLSFEIFEKVIKSHQEELENLNTNLEERIKQEIEKNRKNELYMQENAKLVSMGEMIGNIAHQWRQPLSIISATTSGIDIKKEFGELDDKYIDESLKTINKNVLYLSNTIDTFKNFIKGEKNLINKPIEAEILQAKEIILSALKNNFIKLIDNIDYSSKTVIQMSTDEFSQVIMNILNNAKDVLIENKIDEPWIKLDLFNKANKIIITIEDNGGGISNDVLPHIFEPYFTTKHQSQGTGLGLHMSYRIISESLNGKIWAENTEQGAIFLIELPLT
jgi:signal transduction histidine kinase